MSQTETLLLVILGFALATLIALFVGRLMWRLALRLGARRMQKQVPSSLVGLQTERDRLRAEYAMLSQRLGSRLEATKLKMAEQMAEVARHRNRMEAFEAERLEWKARVTALEGQIAELNQRLVEAGAIHDELRQTIAEKQSVIDSYQYPAPAAPKSAAPQPAYSFDPVSEDRLRRRIGELTALAQTVASDRPAPAAAVAEQQPAPPPAADPVLLDRLNEAERETEDLQRQLETLDQEWSRRLNEIKDGKPPSAAPAEAQPTAVANVISLANRIRELRKGINNS